MPKLPVERTNDLPVALRGWKGHTMLIDAVGLGVVGVADKNDGRYAISAVRLEPDGTTAATDGRVLLAVEPCGLKDEDFPETKTSADVPGTGMVLPCEIVKDVIRNLPKTASRTALLAAKLTAADKDYTELTTTNLSRVKSEGAHVDPDGPGFPAWRDMIPRVDAEAAEYVTINLGVPVLKQLLDTLTKIGHEDLHAITLLVPKAPNKAVVFYGRAASPTDDVRSYAGVFGHTEVKAPGRSEGSSDVPQVRTPWLEGILNPQEDAKPGPKARRKVKGETA